jgi:hypothetical protein
MRPRLARMTAVDPGTRADGGDHDLVRTRALGERLEARLHSGGGAHDVRGEELRDVLPLSEGPLSRRPGFDLVGRKQRTWVPDRLRTELTCAAWWWRSAISSVSAQITPTETVAYGFCSAGDGRNDSRYAATAATLFAAAKCPPCAKGMPIAPASCALYVLDPSKHILGMAPNPGPDPPVRMTFREFAPEEGQELGEQWRVILVSAPEGVRRDLVRPGRPA